MITLKSAFNPKKQQPRLSPVVSGQESGKSLQTPWDFESHQSSVCPTVGWFTQALKDCYY